MSHSADHGGAEETTHRHICHHRILLVDMTEPPLNIDYWASLYSVYTDYADKYDEAMEHTRLIPRAKNLWDWKGLNRTISFERIAPVLQQLDRDEYIDQHHEEAIESLSADLNNAGVVESKSLVTSAFLLHLMASDPNRYSVRFPIYDRRVWNAHVYLWRIRGDGEQLYRQASQSVSQYGAFCRKFRQTCPDDRARDYERALFMFGGFIMSLPPKNAPTSIKTIDEKLETQEKALTNMHDTSRFALINLSEILGSD